VLEWRRVPKVVAAVSGRGQIYARTSLCVEGGRAGRGALIKSPYFRQPEPASGSYRSNFHRPTTGRRKLS
jgi:hypothetical protein